VHRVQFNLFSNPAEEKATPLSTRAAFEALCQSKEKRGELAMQSRTRARAHSHRPLVDKAQSTDAPTAAARACRLGRVAGRNSLMEVEGSFGCCCRRSTVVRAIGLLRLELLLFNGTTPLQAPPRPSKGIRPGPGYLLRRSFTFLTPTGHIGVPKHAPPSTTRKAAEDARVQQKSATMATTLHQNHPSTFSHLKHERLAQASLVFELNTRHNEPQIPKL